MGQVVTSREGFKKLMLRTAVFNYLPPKFQGKSRFLTIFCKNCPGRYSKVMEEWRSLLEALAHCLQRCTNCDAAEVCIFFK